MTVYLPIAELSVNIFIILGMGAAVGFLSGMFGVGGGFLITPLLIFYNIPPVVAVATGANQVVASSVSGALSHFRRGSLDVKLSTPKELGGAGGEGNNPEQLFAAGYSACFLGAMKAVSGKVGVRVPNDAKVTATVGIGPRSEGGFGITADLKISLPGVEHAKAEELVQAAHQICPYSNATRNNVDVGLTVV